MCIRDSLYTNVPVKDTIQIFEHLLRQNNTPEIHIQKIITITKIPLNNQDYKEELNTIKNIALQNGYNPDLINKLHRQIQNKNNKPQNKNNTQQYKYITLTYYNSNKHRIANTFRKHN